MIYIYLEQIIELKIIDFFKFDCRYRVTRNLTRDDAL